MSMSNLQKIQFPSVRDIFNLFDFTGFTTEKYKMLDKQLDEILKIKFTTFKERDDIDNIIFSICEEAQAMGFEQGFQFAVKLLFLSAQS